MREGMRVEGKETKVKSEKHSGKREQDGLGQARMATAIRVGIPRTGNRERKSAGVGHRDRRQAKEQPTEQLQSAPRRPVNVARAKRSHERDNDEGGAKAAEKPGPHPAATVPARKEAGAARENATRECKGKVETTREWPSAKEDQ